MSRILGRVRALRDRRIRDAEACYWIEGVRQFVQAFDVGLQFETIVWSPILLKSVFAERIVRILKKQGVQRVRVTPEQFRSVYLADRASGIGAIVRQHWTPLQQAAPAAGLAWVIVEEVRNPGNLGTILRTAEATEASGLICIGPGCDPFDPAVVRASMGGMFHLPLVRTTCDELAAWCRQHSVHLVGLSPRGPSVVDRNPRCARDGNCRRRRAKGPVASDPATLSHAGSAPDVGPGGFAECGRGCGSDAVRIAPQFAGRTMMLTSLRINVRSIDNLSAAC